MVVPVTCKNDKNQKNQIEVARVFTTFNIDFSDAQGQVNS